MIRSRPARALGCAFLIVSVAGCASAEGPLSMAGSPPDRPSAPAGSPVPPAAPAGSPVPQAAVAAPSQSFVVWRQGFRGKALAQGIQASVFDAAFEGVSPNARVLELDAFQPEFSKPIWEYLDAAVSDQRVETGREMRAGKGPLLDRIEQRFGVDREIVLAIWGLESAYGYNYGDMSVIESLATLAYEGRRQDFAEEQLLSALRILQAGDVTAGRMVGSWAGAMGHTQFIPTSFEQYAVDLAGDGRRDLWSEDAADALASTANYLSRFGWRMGEPAAVEVRLPQGFDYSQADPSIRRPASEWTGMGVSAFGGGGLPAAAEVAIIAPAGARGPAFAAYPNFRTIMRYNNATSYALAASLLAQRIEGGAGIRGEWPRGDRPLSRSERIEMQERLTRLGYDTQGVDGIIGPDSRDAIRDFQQARGMTPDGYDGAALLEALRKAGG